MAQRATSLGPTPSSFFVCFWIVFFLSFFVEQKNCFPPQKGHFCICQHLPLFLPSFFPFPLFTLSFSVCLLFSSFFLPYFLSFLLSFVSLFFSLCFLPSFICFCFMQRTTSKCQILKFVLSLLFCLAFSFNSLFLIFVFLPDFMMCFCLTSVFLVLKTTS